MQQHHLVACDFTIRIPPVKKRKFLPRICSWKLRDLSVTSLFQDKFKEKLQSVDTSPDTAAADTPMSLVEKAWSNLKGPLLDAATEVCGMSKKHRWKPETWWWDDHIEEVVQEKHTRFKVYNNLKKQGKAAEADGPLK